MEKEQFDEFLGGTVQLPRDVQISRLAAARASEIAAMTYSIENPQQSKLVFQKLPVHMRRRVMSHNAKRMPRRLREAHLRQMIKSGLPPKSKRPSRKFRRRPRNLLIEYNRRKRRCEWLETHIWHAKRFRMIEKWNCKIPECPNDKSFRACYRAATNHCLLQDLSYYNCLEIKGPEKFLKDTLKKHCNSEQLTFGARIYADGKREGNLMFFRKNTFPLSPIGNINFLWKPGDLETKTLWLWIHPLIYKDFLEEIIKSFEFQKIETKENNDEKNLSVFYENDKNCLMTNLHDSLNRFRLTGPLSLAILTDALKMPNFKEKSETLSKEDGKNNCDEGINSSMNIDLAESRDWHVDFYENTENLQIFRAQKEFMDNLRTLNSPNQLPPNIVIAATVLDPRFFLPQKRTKILSNVDYYAKILMPSEQAHHSPLWNEELRKSVKDSCKSTNDINKLRSENLIPGVSNDDKFDENVISKVPVIFIQNPGCNDGQRSIGFTSGIDIIIPSGWSMPFWQSFIFRCARAGGLRESRSMALERVDVNSPETHQPDIASHEREAQASMSELREKYFRYPPNRRVNFTKFAITSPFNCEWKILMKEWTNCEEFHVLRNRKSLEILSQALSRLCPRIKRKMITGRKIAIKKNDADPQNTILENKNCLVAVKVTIIGKGRPRNFAIICLPTSEDLKIRKTRKKWSGPVQKFCRDNNQRERRDFRKNHRLMLKRSNKRGYRCRRKAEEVAIALELKKRKGKKSKLRIDRNYAIKTKYREKMQELYLPKCQKVRNSCDREIMGYVTRGDFSFSEARGIGLGFVAVSSLSKIIESHGNLILVRNTQTRQYRFAKIEILNQYR